METWSQIVYIVDCIRLLKIPVFHQICQQKHGIAMIHVQRFCLVVHFPYGLRRLTALSAVSGLSFYLPSVVMSRWKPIIKIVLI